MSKGLTYHQNKARVLYTTTLDSVQITHLENANPFPGIYQERISKRREWRVTVIGEEVFAAAIYTSEDAKDDWRKHQLTSRVKFKKESMPSEEIQRCIDFLEYSGLAYGAFDFIEDEEGNLIFLECNTNGQYKWLEDVLELPISDAIANALISKYEKND